MFKLLILIFIGSFAAQFSIFPKVNAYESKPEVCAKAGCVRGKIVNGVIKPYEAFYGIPYAEPPVGKLRFENPVPFSGWSGYWDASYPREPCLQKHFFKPGQPVLGSEDCLFLNVYRPGKWSRGKKFPVMVFIHGGPPMGFSSDPSVLGPDYIMGNGEIILVTMNHRLGVFGFLCSGDGSVKGNFGLKDQQLALQWVKANIEFFGGDANAITVAGQSTGASSANLHMLNLKSQALFHQVIMMSGSALSPNLYPIDFLSLFRNVARTVGLKDWDTAPTWTLAYQLKKVDGTILASDVDASYIRPCVEGNWDDAFMTEVPRKTWMEGRFAQKPMLISVTSDEGVLEAVQTRNETVLKLLNENIYDLLPVQFDFNPRYVTDVMDFYLDSKDYIDNTNEQGFFKMFRDRSFLYPVITLVNQYLRYANVQKNPVFLYEFGFEGPYTFLKYLTESGENLGVSHYDDLLYLFNMPAFFPPFKPNTPESKMSEILVRTIINFVARGEIKVWRTLKPCTPETSTPFCEWQRFERYEKLDPNQVIVSTDNEIDQEMVKFWSQIDNGVNSIEVKACANL